MRFKDSFHPYAATTIVFWSLTYILTRLALQHFSTFSLGFLRYLIASIVLLAVMVATRMKLPKKADIPWFLLSGGIGFFLYMTAFNLGQAQVTAATGSVVIATAPVLTALLAGVFYRESLRAVQWIAILLEFAGVLVMTLMNGVFSVNSGLYWMLLAALCLSAYNLFQRRLTRTYTALQSSTYSIFAGTLMLAVFAPGSIQELTSAPPVQLVYLGVMSIGSSAVAYVTWAIAFSKAEKTSQVSNYMFATPFLSSFMGFLLAGEVPDRSTLAGGGIILLGVFLFNFGETAWNALKSRKT